ncbi:MAG: BatA and WFA domain-containing protein [Acidobacteriaceae bacterium]|nr:BatA and WFA domain-containing protein [Acidobacteriaceae bacterium]
MGFLSPWFLLGIAAVALPLWLHLLRQFKRTPQPFSSLMFFERRVQSSVLHRRLRYLVLLAMRMALITLLALAFASPFINRTTSLGNRRRLVIVAIDRSFSMRADQRLQQAKDQARRVLNALPGNALVQVVAIDSRVEALTPADTNRDAAAAAIERLQPDDLASSFGEFARAMRVMDQTSGMRLNVHLISDMQQSSMPPAFKDMQLGSHTSLNIYPVGAVTTPNWAVENVTVPAHVYDATHTRLTATIAGWATPAANRTVSLMLDGRVLASKDVSIPPNGAAQVDFNGFEVPYGAHRGEVRLAENDELPQDDSFPFAIERNDPRKVLFLYADGRPRQALYYKAALESVLNPGLVLQVLPVEQANGQDFSKFAYVVLNDVGDLGSTLADALCGYVQHGGAVFIALGPNTAQAGRIPLSSDRFGELRQLQGAGFIDSESPELASAGKFENVQFSETGEFTMKSGARVLAKLADGSPLLLEQHMGEGRKLIFASTLDASTSDFPLHASYLPFVIQTGRYLAGYEEGTSSLVAGSPVGLRRARSQDTTADVIGPDGKHELSLSQASKALSFDLDRAGFYDVHRADGHHLLMAAHSDRRESDLKQVPGETLDLWRNTGDTAAKADSGGVEQQTRPWSFWRYVMILVLLVAVMESVFASRYLSEGKRAA